MAKIGIFKEAETFKAYFHCPGCDGSHAVIIRNVAHGWQYNENVHYPTFTPSVLVNSTQLTADGERQCKAWATAGYPVPADQFDSVATVCHSYVTDGKIQFLDDCTHALAGQTVDLPNWEF